jgi:hypothetical protein
LKTHLHQYQTDSLTGDIVALNRFFEKLVFSTSYRLRVCKSVGVFRPPIAARPAGFDLIGEAQLARYRLHRLAPLVGDTAVRGALAPHASRKRQVRDPVLLARVLLSIVGVMVAMIEKRRNPLPRLSA